MLSVLITGLAIGALYSAAALAYNVMYSTSKVLSITTGHIFMVSSVAGAFLIGDLGLPKLVGLVGAIIIAIFFGLATERIAIRRILARSEEHLPETVYGDTCRKRVCRAHNPARQSQPVIRQGFVHRG